MNALDYTRDLVSFGSISATSNAEVSNYVQAALSASSSTRSGSNTTMLPASAR